MPIQIFSLLEDRMVSFNTGAFASITIGGSIVGACLWNKLSHGLIYGVMQSVITIAIKELFGKTASTLYVAGIGVYLITREVLKYVNKDTSESPKIRVKKWNNPDRLEIYKETIKFIDNGFYNSPEGRRFDLKSGIALCQDSITINNRVRVAEIKPRYANQQIIVVKQDCLETAKKLVEEGRKVVVVNFAAHNTPGGRADQGTNGQEEDLCYRSEFAGVAIAIAGQSDASGVQFYPLEGFSEQNEQLDHLIHTPNVFVFRASREYGYALLNEPFKVGILTTAAPYQPELTYQQNLDYAREEDKLRVRTLITTQLYAAYIQNYDTVILGAFGCGYYKNPPQAVAKLYKEVIDTSFRGAFQKIVFAILDDEASRGIHNPTGNFLPFHDSLKK